MSESDPVENLPEEQIVTEGCPCGEMHGRAQYEETGLRFRDAKGEYDVLRCPMGRQVYMIFPEIVLDDDPHDLHARIEINEVPADAKLFARRTASDEDPSTS